MEKTENEDNSEETEEAGTSDFRSTVCITVSEEVTVCQTSHLLLTLLLEELNPGALTHTEAVHKGNGFVSERGL